MNKVIINGRACDDVQLRYSPNGKPIASGTIAVQRKFKNAQGQYDADFLDFTCWGKGGEIMSQYIKKGDQFCISGTLQTRIWDKQDGSKQKIVEINVEDFDLPAKPKNGQNSNQGNQSSNHKNNQNQGNTKPQTPFENDPFGDSTPFDLDDGSLPF